MKTSAFGKVKYAINDLLWCLALQFRSVICAMLHTDSCPQQTQIVVHLSNRPHCRSWVARSRLLINRNRRRQTFDDVNVWFVHLPKKLPRIGAQTLDVTSLTFCVNGVESQTRLARTRQPRKHHKLITRQIHADIFEVVLARTTNRDMTCVVHGRFHFCFNYCRRLCRLLVCWLSSCRLF